MVNSQHYSRPATLWTKDFIGITIINFLIFCGFQMLVPTLPLFVKHVGCSDSVIGWLVGISTLATLLIRPFCGLALDRFGRKVILIIGIGLVIITTLVYHWLAIIAIILAVRFIQGLGWGICTTASSTVATDTLPKSRFGEGMGYFSLSVSLGIAIGPTIGLSVMNAANFTFMSFVAAGVSFLAILLALFIKYRKIVPSNISKISIDAIFEKTAIRPAVLIFLACCCNGAIFGFISLYGLEKGIENIGLYFAFYAISSLLTRPLIGKMIDRFGFDVVIFPGIVLVAGGLLAIGSASNLTIFLLGAVFFGVGFAAVMTTLQTMSVLFAPRARFGAANATFYIGFDAGTGFGSILAGFVASLIGYGPMFSSFSLFMLCAAVLYLVFKKNDSKPSADSDQ